MNKKIMSLMLVGMLGFGIVGCSSSEVSEVDTDSEAKVEDKVDVPLENQQALAKAKVYLKTSPFSAQGLRDQLEYEQYKEEAIQYALDNIEVDYKEQALEKAKLYLKTSSFSEESMKTQLEYEGFSEEEVQYAVDNLY